MPWACSSTSDVVVSVLTKCYALALTLLLLVYSNAQHSITGMTKGELEEGTQRRRLGNTQGAVIVVKKHKTGRPL